MPNLSDIATSREFRTSDRETQRGMLSKADPKGFGALIPPEQDQLLERVDAELGRPWYDADLSESFSRGYAKAMSGFAHTAANVVDLSAPDAIRKGMGQEEQTELQKYLRALSEDLAEAGESPRDRTTSELAAEIVGQVATSVPIYAGATMATGAALAAAGVSAPWVAALSPIVAFGALGGMSAADRGFVEAMKAATVDAAFGMLFPGLASTGRGVRAGVFGTAAFKMAPEDMELDERLGHGITMSVLGALHGARAPFRPPRRGIPEAREALVEPEVQAKMQAEEVLTGIYSERGFQVAEREAIAEARLLLPAGTESAKAMDEKTQKLPPEERQIVEDMIQAERVAEQERAPEPPQTPAPSAPAAAPPADRPGIIDEAVPPPRAEVESQGDLSAAGARGRTAATPPTPPGVIPASPPGVGVTPPAPAGPAGVVPTAPAPAAPSPPVPIRYSTKWDKRRQEYIDDGHGILWMVRKGGLEDIPDNAWAKFHNLRGIPDAQDGMIKWGVPALVPDPMVPGRRIVSFRPTRAYEVTRDSNGNLVAAPSATETIEGPLEIMKSVMGHGKRHMEEFGRYATARQAEELQGQTIDMRTGTIRPSTAQEILDNKTREKLWDPQDIADGKALETPEYLKVYEEMKEYNRKVMDFLVDMDFVTREQSNAFMRKEYAFSFRRRMELGKQGRHRREDSLGKVFGIRKLVGSKKDLQDWFTNFITGPQDLFRAAMQNRWARDTVDDALRIGGFVDRVKPSSDLIRLGSERLKLALQEEVQSLHGLTPAQSKAYMRWIGDMPGDIERIAFFHGADRPYGSDIISIIRNGKPEYYKGHDPVFLRAFESLNRKGRTNVAMHWMQAFKRFRQELITTDPTFMVGNAVRDPVMSSVMTKTGNQHLTASIRGMMRTTGHSKEFRDFVANGLGGSSMRDPVALTRKRLIRHAERMNYRFLDPRKMLVGPGDVFWNFMREVGRAIEMGPRIGEALRARETGVKGPTRGQPASMEAAVNAGREVSTDFAVRGGGEPTGVEGLLTGTRFGFTAGPEVMKFLGDTVLFFNPMISGADRAYRAVARDPYGKMAVGFKMGMVGVSSTLLYAINRDLAILYAHLKDEDGRTQVDFLNLPQWAQSTAWHYYVPTEWNQDTGEITQFTHFTQPKIWEVGMIGTWGERLAESMLTGSEEDKDLFKDLIDITASNFNIHLLRRGLPIPLPSGIDLIVEQGMNRIGFTGQPIESSGMGEWEPYMRSKGQTPIVLQELGYALRKQEWVPDVIRSPLRAEALLRGIFGNWASMGLILTDEVLYPGGPALGWDDLPILKRFYQEAGKYDENTELFYRNLERFNQAQGSIRELAKRGEKDIVRDIRLDDDQRAMIMMAPGFDRANRRMQLLNREIDLLKRRVADPDATPRERHHSINKLEAQRNRVMKAINEQAEHQIKKQRKKGASKREREALQN